MLETDELILDKAKFSDWKDIYYNVWSRPESAKYMAWTVTENEDDAKARIERTIAFQKNHDTYFVYHKPSGKAIGFAGVEKTAPYVYRELGICLGPDYVGRGFGRQILKCLIQYCKGLGGKEFIYQAREENKASCGLAKSFGFKLVNSEPDIDGRDGRQYNLLTYKLET